jgi:hypothetical protein
MRFKYSAGIKPLVAAAEKILDGILEKCNVSGALVTSTVRTPDDQARIMYENIERYGIKAQRQLYKAAGKLIIDVYESQKSMGANADAVKHAMAQKIVEIGPEKISAHCTADPNKSVFDVSPSSIPEERKNAWVNQVSVTPGLIRFLRPPADPAYHIEIKISHGEEA